MALPFLPDIRMRMTRQILGDHSKQPEARVPASFRDVDGVFWITPPWKMFSVLKRAAAPGSLLLKSHLC